MALNTSYDGLLAVNRLPINLKQTQKDACVVCSHHALRSDNGADCVSVLTVQTPLG